MQDSSSNSKHTSSPPLQEAVPIAEQESARFTSVEIEIPEVRVVLILLLRAHHVICEEMCNN